MTRLVEMTSEELVAEVEMRRKRVADLLEKIGVEAPKKWFQNDPVAAERCRKLVAEGEVAAERYHKAWIELEARKTDRVLIGPA